jgi:hypothetical protein
MGANMTFKRLTSIIALAVLIPSQALADVPQSVDYNAIYYNTEKRCKTTEDTGIFIGSDAIETSFKYFVSLGLTPEQSAGIVGNLRWESGGGVIDPTAQEVHRGVPTPIPNEGFGIAQWTFPSRQQNLVAYASSVNKPVNTLQPQLGFLWKELGESYGDTLAKLKNSTTINDAVIIFQDGFEKPNPAKAHTAERIKYAQQTYDLYAGSVSSTNAAPTSAANPKTTPVCGGGLGVSSDFTFPLRTTQEKIKAGSWCWNSSTSCHHDYLAADIFDIVGTPVVAAVGGTVVRAVDKVCAGGTDVPRVQIKGTDGIYYYYTHMSTGSIKVHDGQEIPPGTELGTIGPSNCAEGTPPHLHFQMSSVMITNTEDQSERSHYIDPQPNLTATFQKLPGLQL